MTKLYVANCTRQQAEIHYRLDFTDKGEREPNSRFQPAKKQTIPPGRQTEIGRDLHPAQADDVVKQLQRFGMIAVLDVGNQKKIAPYVFNMGMPVPSDVIRRVQNRNHGLLIEQGRQRREQAAIVVNKTVENAVNAEMANGGLPPVDQVAPTEVEFEQLDQVEGDTGKMLGEGFRVDPAAPGPRGGKGGSRSRKK